MSDASRGRKALSMLLQSRKAHRAQRPCPGLGIGGSRGPLRLQLSAPWVPREARRLGHPSPKLG
eukprot:9797187-Alexandrium_andersonii.AAC.1